MIDWTSAALPIAARNRGTPIDLTWRVRNRNTSERIHRASCRLKKYHNVRDENY